MLPPATVSPSIETLERVSFVNGILPQTYRRVTPAIDGSCNAGKRILSVGDDPLLLRTRELLLEGCGFSVVSVSGSISGDRLSALSLDLLILCHSLRYGQSRLVDAIRATCPELPILLLLGASALPQVHNTTAIRPKPDALIQTVKAMLLAKTTQKVMPDWEDA